MQEVYLDREYALNTIERNYQGNDSELLFSRLQNPEIKRQACDLMVRLGMNQLKNYFGFKGTEVFTNQHLDIAREYYLADTGMDNDMTEFFQAITPETEAKFLELINTSGI